jgi:transcriptional regulator with XRE-family HTH domain
VSPADRRRLGRWLRSQRLARGLTATAIARKIGCDGSHICSLEKGRYSPSLDVLDRWLSIYGIDLLGMLGARDTE